MANAGTIDVTLLAHAGQFLGQMKVAMGALKDFATGAVKMAAEFEQGMVRVAAVSQATQQQFRDMTQAALSMAAKTQYTAREVADGMSFLAMAGMKPTQIIEAMPHALDLAAAGMIGIADASDIVTNVMAGMGLQMEDLARANDTIVSAITGSNVDVRMLGEAFKYVGPIAQGTGTSFEEVTAALGLLGNAGIQGSMAGTTLRGALSRLSSPSKEAARLMKQYGIETKDANGNMLSLSEIVQNLQMSGMADDTERVGAMLEIFGERAGPGMVALTSLGGEALAKFTQRLEGAGGTAKRIADLQMQTLTGRIKIMESAFEGLAINIGQRFIPATKNIVNKITSIVNWFNSWSDSNKNLALQIMSTVSAVIILVGAVGLLMKFFKSAALKSVITTFAGILVPVLAVAAAIGGVILAVGSIRMAFDQNKQELQKIVSDIKGFFVDLWESIISGVTTAAEAVVRLMMSMIEPINKALQPITEGIIMAVGFVTRQKPEETQAIIEEARKEKGGLLNLDETLNTIKKWAGVAGDKLAELGKDVADFAKSTGSAMIDYAKMFASDTKDGMKAAWNAGLKTLSIDKLVDMLKGTFGKYVKIGGGEIKIPDMKLDIGELDEDARRKLDEVNRRLADLGKSTKTFSEVFKQVRGQVMDQLISATGEIGSVIAAAKQGFETGGVWGAIIAVVVQLLQKTQFFSATVTSLNMSLDTLVQFLDFLLKPFAQLLPVFNMYIHMMVTFVKSFLLLNQIMPWVGKAMKAAAEILMDIMRKISNAWDWVIDHIANWIAKFSQKAAAGLRRMKINFDYTLRDVEAQLTGFGSSVETLAKNVNASSDAISNAPEGFKIALERYRAIVPGATSSSAMGGLQKPSVYNDTKIYVEVNTDADPDEIAKAVAREQESYAWRIGGSTTPAPNAPYGGGTNPVRF